MANQESLPTILAQFPELSAVEEALSADQEGREVTALCYKCRQPLVVTHVQGISTWVMCGKGCTRFHMKYTPK